jgi:hypothetical protein
VTDQEFAASVAERSARIPGVVAVTLGGGVMIGGGWLGVDGRQVDLHDRDLDQVEHWLAEGRLGRFRVERLRF